MIRVRSQEADHFSWSDTPIMGSDSQTWYALSAEEAAAALDCDLEQGLTSEQVRERQARYGPNELQEAPGRSFWQMLLDQFNQFLVLILIAAAVISALIGWSEYNRTGDMTEFVDAAAIR